MVDVNAVRSRLGSLSPSALEQIKDLSAMAWRVLTMDLPEILDVLGKGSDAYVESVSVASGKRVVRRMPAGRGAPRVLEGQGSNRHAR